MVKKVGIAIAAIVIVIIVVAVVFLAFQLAVLLTPTPTPTTPEVGIEWFQTGNTQPITELKPKQSGELANNYIGTDLGSYDPGYANSDVVYSIGFKWIRISFNTDPLNWQRVEREAGKYSIDADADRKITEYAHNGIKIVLNLGVGDWVNRLDTTRFRDQEEVERYGNFVRFMVRHFKDRIQYYELWNEPGDIAVQDYAKLVRHVIPIIREEYPEAKIVIGAVPGKWEYSYPGYGESGRFSLNVDYLRSLLMSGVAPLADAVSWHPFYGNRPDDPYYQSYPQIVKEIKELALSEGFQGEFFAEESVWRTAGDQSDPMIQRVTESVAAKYFLRSIVIHRGLDIIVTIALPGAHDPTLPKVRAIHNMCDIMAGAKPVSVPIEVQCEATNIESYSFSLSNGDTLTALWTDGVAVDNDLGVEANLTFHGFTAQDVTGIDVLEGFQQPITISNENRNLAIQNLIVRDYPLILRITKSSAQ